jgi:hypothetical protein
LRHPKCDCDAAKLASVLTTGQDNLFASYRAKYLLVLGQWRQEIMDKRKQKAAGEKK